MWNELPAQRGGFVFAIPIVYYANTGYDVEIATTRCPYGNRVVRVQVQNCELQRSGCAWCYHWYTHYIEAFYFA